MTNTLKAAANRVELFSSWQEASEQGFTTLGDLDLSLQTRVEGTDEELVEEYVVHMKAGVEFPPLDLFAVGALLHLVDGYHRYEAYRKLEKESVSVRIFRGHTYEEAKLYAHFSNMPNGRAASKEDLQGAIIALLKMDKNQEQFFKSKYVLDVAKLAKWAVCSPRLARHATGELREHLQEMRKAEVALHSRTGESGRVIADRLRTTQPTVAKVLKELGDATPSIIADHFIGEELELETEEAESMREEALKKIERVNQQGYETILRNMEKKRKQGQALGLPPKTDHVKNAANALVSLSVCIDICGVDDPSGDKLAEAVRKDENLMEDLSMLAEILERLKRATVT